MSSSSVPDALAVHYRSHGLPADGGAHSPWFKVHLGPVVLTLPNPPARRRAVFYHDVNHLITGYNTVFSEGEMDIAAFELGSGCGRFLIAWFINLVVVGIGLLTRPRAVFRAFVRGRRTLSIYEWGDPETLARCSVRQVAEALGLPSDQLPARTADVIAFATAAAGSLAIITSPVILLLTTLVLLRP